MTSTRRPPAVHKFGGASLADGAAMQHAVAIIQDLPPEPAVIVASAMAGVTDRLLELGRQAAAGRPADSPTLSALRKQHVDAARLVVRTASTRRSVLAAIEASLDEAARAAGWPSRGPGAHGAHQRLHRRPGERLSAMLLAAALADTRRRVRLLDAAELIVTDGTFGGAAPDLAATDRRVRTLVAPLLRHGAIPVIPGFIGAGPGGDLVTLGRGGSDLTATLLARALRASSVSLWKDVPGFLTGDPRVVADARVIPDLHVKEAAELAYYGAKVLHPRALTPLNRRSIPVYVRPFADPASQGTEVSQHRRRLLSPVRAVSGIGGQALITVTGNGMLGVPGIAARTFRTLQATGLPVSLVTQGSSEASLTFSVPGAQATQAEQALRREFAEEIGRQDIDGIEVRRDMATVAVVGRGMAGARGVAARVFGALAHAGINIVAIAQGSSELNISFVIEERDAAEAQRRIHEAFQLAKIGVAPSIHPSASRWCSSASARSAARLPARFPGRAVPASSSKCRP